MSIITGEEGHKPGLGVCMKLLQQPACFVLLILKL